MGIIVGYEKEKREITGLHDMLQNSNMYRHYGVRIPRGLALYGEPGVGKTVLARSIAGDGINLVELRSADCCEEDAPEAIKSVFEEAKRLIPSVILLDELDKIAGTSTNFFMESNDAVKKTLLQELDALSEEDDILVVATCNDTDVLGDALLRPGRFDRQLHIDLPNEETREQILEEYFARLKVEKEVDLKYLAKLTHGYTGAKLECLANEAGIKAMEKPSPRVDMEDIRIIMNKFAFGGNEQSPFSDMGEVRKIAIHEAGHALVAMLIAPDSIHGASVLPQGESAGHIQFINPEKGVTSVKDVENEITVLLAGRVAERMILGEYMTGACSDIAMAATRLQFLITDCAAYGYEATPFSIHTRPREDVVSNDMKCRANALLVEKMEELDRFAELLIEKAYPAFEAIVGYLMEKHTLTRDELFEILMNYGLDQSIA